MPLPIPLSQPDITQAEVDAVLDVLHSGLLTRGPRVEQFEQIIARLSDRRHAVAASSGTAGLHCAMPTAGVGAGGGAGGGAAGGAGGQRPIGSFGRAGVFSFYTNTQITTGEGGMIVTDDDTFANTCRALRSHGRQTMTWLAHHRLGYNYRLDELSAALGVAQAQRIEEILDARRRVAHAYMERLMTNRYLILPTLLDETPVRWC